MSEYPKTQNLYASNGGDAKGAGHERGPQYGYGHPSFATIGEWLVLDKLDGMNMRVTYRNTPPAPQCDSVDPDVLIQGRTDKANLPGDLIANIQAWATPAAFQAVFGEEREVESGTITYLTRTYPETVILYGEGIGPGIQGAAGQAYGGVKRFVLFDVKVGYKWLDWDDVRDVAYKLGIDHADTLATGVDLADAMAAAVCPYFLGDESPRPYVEGGVLRTDPYLFDWRGNRITAKYKVRDL